MRHPVETVLLDQALGEADLAQRAVVEAHLAACGDCRRGVDELAETAGVLSTAGAGRLDHPAPGFSALAPALAARAPIADRLPADAPLPASVRALLAGAEASWIRIPIGGARLAKLAEDGEAGLFLMHMPGGRAFPRHIHVGEEQVTVLAGGYGDQLGEFEAGDFGAYAPGSSHAPATLDGDDCWILFRLDAPVRFTGWRGVLQRLFT